MLSWHLHMWLNVQAICYAPHLQASLTCAITGPVSLRQGDIGKLAGPQVGVSKEAGSQLARGIEMWMAIAQTAVGSHLHLC